MSGDIDTIQKAVISYFIDSSSSPPASYSSLYFLEIGRYSDYTLESGYDSDNEIVNSLRDINYNVKKISEGDVIFSTTQDGIYDKKKVNRVF